MSSNNLPKQVSQLAAANRKFPDYRILLLADMQGSSGRKDLAWVDGYKRAAVPSCGNWQISADLRAVDGMSNHYVHRGN